MWMYVYPMGKILGNSRKPLFLCASNPAHTDGGSQYFSKLYLTGFQSLGIQISVANNCLQNGYFGQQNCLFKNHLIPTINYYPGMNITHEIKRITGFYNYDRKQPKLVWLSPIEFEQKWHKKDGRPKIELHDFDKLDEKPYIGFQKAYADRNIKKNGRNPKKLYSVPPKSQHFSRSKLFLDKLLPSRACFRLTSMKTKVYRSAICKNLVFHIFWGLGRQPTNPQSLILNPQSLITNH